MRRLDEEQLRDLLEIADRVGEEVARGGMVGIEDRDEVAGRDLEAVVHVAGLGVLVLLARQVAAAEIGGELLQLDVAILGFLSRLNILGIALLHGAAVVEQPHGQLVGRIVHRLGGGERGRQKRRLLIVGRHEHVDGRQVGVGRGHLQRPRRHRPHHDEQRQEQHEDAVHFREIDEEARNEVFRLVDRRQRAGRAPIGVTQHDRRSERERDLAPDALPREQLQEDHRTDDDSARDEMCLQVDRQRDQDRHHDGRECPDKGINYPRHAPFLSLARSARGPRPRRSPNPGALSEPDSNARKPRFLTFSQFLVNIPSARSLGLSPIVTAAERRDSLREALPPWPSSSPPPSSRLPLSRPQSRPYRAERRPRPPG